MRHPQPNSHQNINQLEKNALRQMHRRKLRITQTTTRNTKTQITKSISDVTFTLLREFAELKETKKQTDKLVELFQTKNMTEAKKIINRSSQDAQKIV